MLRIALMLFACSACAVHRPPHEPAAPTAAADPFDASALLPDVEELAAEPQLDARLREDLHAFFRYINVAFSSQVCGYFAERLASMPTVTLHGDAHLEQYAVTEAGRGLTDFDDASKGPAVVDLVRFGVSLELAARAHGWEASFDASLEEFLRGYRAGLARPDTEIPEPAAARRMRAGFAKTREGYLAWATGLIQPMPADEDARLRAAFASYADTLRKHSRDIPEGFFVIENAGPFRLGVGSALDEKYLLRVRGPSDDALDDVVLEAKEIRSLAGIPCVTAGPKADPFRFLAGPIHVPYRPYLGIFSLHGVSFWVHAWLGNYEELEIGETLRSAEELMQIAYESGVQLARAHVEGLGATPDPRFADEQVEIVDSLAPDIENAVRLLAQATIRAWHEFRTRAD